MLLCATATLACHFLLPLAARADENDAASLPGTSPAAVSTVRSAESGTILAVALLLAAGLVVMERGCSWRLRQRSRTEANARRLQDCLPSNSIGRTVQDHPANRDVAEVSRAG